MSLKIHLGSRKWPPCPVPGAPGLRDSKNVVEYQDCSKLVREPHSTNYYLRQVIRGKKNSEISYFLTSFTEIAHDCFDTPIFKPLEGFTFNRHRFLDFLTLFSVQYEILRVSSNRRLRRVLTRVSD